MSPRRITVKIDRSGERRPSDQASEASAEAPQDVLANQDGATSTTASSDDPLAASTEGRSTADMARVDEPSPVSLVARYFKLTLAMVCVNVVIAAVNVVVLFRHGDGARVVAQPQPSVQPSSPPSSPQPSPPVPTALSASNPIPRPSAVAPAPPVESMPPPAPARALGLGSALGAKVAKPLGLGKPAPRPSGIAPRQVPFAASPSVPRPVVAASNKRESDDADRADDSAGQPTRLAERW